MVDFELINLRVDLSQATVAFMDNLILKGASKDCAEKSVMNVIRDAFDHVGEKLR